MSDDEIDRAVKDAQQYEAEDKKRKEAIDTKNEADSFAFQTENAINEVGDKLDASAKSEVEADLKALKDILAKHADAADLTESDVDEIKAAKSKLETSAQKVFSAMYENMQQAQGAAGPGAGPAPDMNNMGGGQTGGSSSSDDGGPDVVDADYREV